MAMFKDTCTYFSIKGRTFVFFSNLSKSVKVNDILRYVDKEIKQTWFLRQMLLHSSSVEVVK